MSGMAPGGKKAFLLPPCSPWQPVPGCRLSSASKASKLQEPVLMAYGPLSRHQASAVLDVPEASVPLLGLRS